LFSCQEVFPEARTQQQSWFLLNAGFLSATHFTANGKTPGYLPFFLEIYIKEGIMIELRSHKK
jgi:hypothetical protein